MRVTTQEVHTIPVASIQTGERFREDYGDIDDLASSIRTYGLLQPIVISREHRLIAGGRRLAAHLRLGLENIQALYRDEVDDLLARELELEENVRRKDLTWQERAKLVLEIDTIKKARYGDASLDTTNDAYKATPGWDSSDTATALDVDRSTVSRDLAAARILEAMPELTEVSDRVTAIKIFDRRLEALERELAVRRSSRTLSNDFRLGDARSLIKDVPDNSVDLIIMDPPYATDATDFHSNRNYNEHKFDDSFGSTMELLDALAPELRRVLKPEGHFYCFTSAAVFADLRSLFTDAGFPLDTLPIIWVKNSDGLADWDYRYAFGYEMILYSSSPLRKLARKRSNVFQFDIVPPTQRTNIAEKPYLLIKEILEMSSIEGETVLDVCAGSASVPVACVHTKRRFIAFEIDPNQHNEGVLRIENAVRRVAEEEAEDDPVQEPASDLDDDAGPSGAPDEVPL